ncbi:hypothetical protein PFISCL1PPCAC_15736, partial [Pristionchus fissidentatus]
FFIILHLVKMGIQEFELMDYIAPIVAGVFFSILLFVSSIFINFMCITKKDDITEFERWGAKHNIRAGPHRLSVINQYTDKRFICD